MNRFRIFALVVGLTDGVLTALTLASGRIVDSGQPVTAGLALRVALASSLSGTFVFFTADYVRQRSEIVHAEKQLNLRREGHYAARRLARAILRDSVKASMLASVCNFAGAISPLMAGALVPSIPTLSIAVALVFLGAFGFALAGITRRNRFAWSAALIGCGGALTAAGIVLRIV